MTSNPSLTARIAMGKAIGFAIGLIGFVFLRQVVPDADPMLSWGILLWYGTLGAIIGVYGVFDRHPIMDLPLPWWFRAPALGAWMNFVLTLFIYDRMETLLV
ncbi:MAG: hypothetical protein AAGF59_13200 [Pseudomonadota bacterium]